MQQIRPTELEDEAQRRLEGHEAHDVRVVQSREEFGLVRGVHGVDAALHGHVATASDRGEPALAEKQRVVVVVLGP